VPAVAEGSESDAAIREKLMEEMDRQPWAPKGLINVIVKDGVASLWGSITDEREREALHVLAENTPGVRGVHDRLVWVEPTSGFVISSGEEPPEAKAS
jgi:osmotically-inducible protein OsmY